MAKVDPTIQVATAIGIAVVGIDGFHKFLPSVSEVRNAKPGDAGIRADVHAGEFITGIGVMTVAILATSVSGSPLPMFIGGMSFLAMFATYEYLLHNTRPFE